MFMVMRSCLLRLWTLILLQVPIQASQGLVIFKIKQLDYLSGQCCNIECGSTKSSCTTYFDLCLKDSLSPKNDPCIIEKSSKTGVTEATKNLDVHFQSSYDKPMILILRGKLKTGQILFEISDDKLLTFTNPTWHQLETKTKTAHLSIEYKLSCRPNHYGKNCKKYCLGSRSDVLGHYDCDKLGNRVCHAGWKGSYCTKRTCFHTCVQGKCEESRKECVCHKGWYGDGCDIDMKLCYTRPCLNEGSCSSNGKCLCKCGFYGNRCEKTLGVSTSSMLKESRSDSSISTPVIATTSQRNYTVSTSHNSLFYSTHSLFSKTNITQTTTIVKHSILNQSEITNSLPSIKHSTVSKNSPLLSSMFTQTSAFRSTTYHSTSQISTNSSTHMLTTIPSIASTFTPFTRSKPKPTSIMLPLVIVTVVVLLLLSLIAFLFLWKRSKLRGRQSQTPDSSPIKNVYKNSLSSVPSTNSVSTATSVTPILKKCYDTDSGTGFESHDVDIISVLDYPFPLNDVNDQNSYDMEKYTIKAVDQICWEVINGSEPIVYHHGNKTRQKRGSKDILINKEVHAKRKSQTSSAYSSSGYCSSTASLKPGSAASHQSIRSYTSQCFSLEDVYCLADNSFEQNNNNHHGINREQSKDKSSEIVELVDYMDTKQETLSQNRRVYESITFEGLPNFVTY